MRPHALDVAQRRSLSLTHSFSLFLYLPLFLSLSVALTACALNRGLTRLSGFSHGHLTLRHLHQ